MLKSRFLAASALASSLLLAPVAAFAQDVAPAAPQGETQAEGVAKAAPDSVGAPVVDEGEQVVITGSRIRRPNLDSGAPITTVSGAEFFQTGKVSVGDILNELPQLATTFSQQQSTRFLGTRGLNLVDLRNLGTSRTLVLVNGRRHVAGDVLNSGVSVDINTIPTDLIESVDVITGYGSSIYGSDAIAGALNFKLKQDYEGLQVRGQSGLSQYGDGSNQYVRHSPARTSPTAVAISRSISNIPAKERISRPAARSCARRTASWWSIRIPAPVRTAIPTGSS